MEFVEWASKEVMEIQRRNRIRFLIRIVVVEVVRGSINLNCFEDRMKKIGQCTECGHKRKKSYGEVSVERDRYRILRKYRAFLIALLLVLLQESAAAVGGRKRAEEKASCWRTLVVRSVKQIR